MDILNQIVDTELRESIINWRNSSRKKGRPRKDISIQDKENEFKRYTIYLRENEISKLKFICEEQNVTIKEFMSNVISLVISSYEKKNGIIQIK